MTPEAEAEGLRFSATPGAADDTVRERASRAAEQAWMTRLYMGISVVVDATLRCATMANRDDGLKCRWGIGSMAGGYELGAGGASAASWISSRMASKPPAISDAPIPITQAVQPRRSKTWPSTALPTRPPRK